MLSFLPSNYEFFVLAGALFAVGSLVVVLVLNGKRKGERQGGAASRDTSRWDEGVADRADGSGDAAGDFGGDDD